MARGRKALPDPIKEIKGTARPDRANPSPPVSAVGTPVVPADMSPEEQTAWEGFAATLTNMKVLCESHGPYLYLLTATWVEWHRLHKACTAEGFEDVYFAPNGTGGGIWRKRPEIEMRADAARRLSGLLASGGLDPASMYKVRAPDDGSQKGNAFAEL